MADTIDLETLERLANETGWEGLDKIVEGLKSAGTEMLSLNELTEKFGSIINNDTIQVISKFQDVLNNVKETGTEFVTDLTKGFLGLGDAQEITTENLAAMGVKAGIALEPLIGVIPKGITGLGQLGDTGATAGAKITGSFKTLEPVMSKILGGTDSMAFSLAQQASEGANSAFTLQRSLIALAGAQGQLGLVTSETGERFEGLNESYDNMINLAYTSAQATGQSVESMLNLSQTVGTIPDALSEPIETAQGTMSQLVVTSQLSTAFMRDQSEVAQQLANMYTNLGTSGEAAYEAIANIYENAGDSKLRFEAFNSTVMNIAESFKMIGENTEAATNVVKAFDEAFRDSDISPAAMEQVIGGLARGVEQMELGTAAFVSAQTGGPGGLAGAFEIELAKREGRMDEVMQRTMEALETQFGGPALSLEDATQNQNLAGEFFKQSQFIQQFLGVGKDESFRVLEAMKDGALDLMENAIGRPDEGARTALDTALERGQAEQIRTRDPLIGFQQEMELTRSIQNKMFAQGSEHLAEGRETNELLKSMRDMAAGSGTAGAIGGERFATFNEVRLEDKLSDVAASGSDMFKAVADAFNVKEGGVGKLLSGMLSKEEKPEIDADSIFREQVGARLPPPGSRAGLTPFAGELAPVATAPVGFGELAAGGGKGGANEVPTIPVELSSEPVVVQVEFGEPFRQIVREEVMTTINKKQSEPQAQVARGSVK